MKKGPIRGFYELRLDAWFFHIDGVWYQLTPKEFKAHMKKLLK